MNISELLNIATLQKETAISTDTGIKRDLLLKLPQAHSLALILTGIRGCGKSTLARQYLNKIGQDYFYMNFEDIRLSAFETEDYSKLDKLIKDSKCKWLFFDGIQNTPKWELYVRQKLNENFRVVLTGANASMLGIELGTKHAGRYLEKELFSFSYSEFLKLAKKKRCAKTLDEYLQFGGFPEYINTGNANVLVNLQNDILYRDIAVRYKLRDIASLRRLFVYLVSNASQKISPSNLTFACGIKSPTTVLEYLAYFEHSFLIQVVPQFAGSLKAQSLAPKKVYISDLGLMQTASLSFGENIEALLENFVFNHLRLQTKDIWHFSHSNFECDFIAKQAKDIFCIQVCSDLNTDNQDRKINGVFCALDFFKTKEGYIFTRNSKDKIVRKGKIVHILPAWESF